VPADCIVTGLLSCVGVDFERARVNWQPTYAVIAWAGDRRPKESIEGTESMIRGLLKELGPTRATVFMTLLSIISSLTAYLFIGLFAQPFAYTGVALSIVVPAVVAPMILYAVLKLAHQLDQAEEALQAANDALESRVQQRTRQLAAANDELQSEVSERGRVEEELRVSLREKEVLLQEVHHRVKNNLQVVSSLLSLQAARIDDDWAEAIFLDCQTRVMAMALIHEELYRSENLAHVHFAGYIRSLVGHLFASYDAAPDRVSLQWDLDECEVDVDTAIPCGLIVNELVSNALKHAFHDRTGAEIVIGLHSVDGGRVAMSVADNGVGLPDGLDVSEADTLGLQLVSTLVSQLDGQLEVDRSGGTAFTITFASGCDPAEEVTANEDT
jgi:two-component sensor histidine kinase